VFPLEKKEREREKKREKRRERQRERGGYRKKCFKNERESEIEK
jgi:hypothetical protein